MDIMYYVGIDIGHGETCVSRAPGYGDKVSRIPLNNAGDPLKQKVVSAICRDHDSKWRFYDFDRKDATCNDIRIGFKGRIDRLPEREKESLKEFVKIVFNTILERDSDLQYNEETGEANFKISFANPTGWREDDPKVPDEYLEFFVNECGIKPAFICINESDAAYYTKHKDYKEDDVVLVIDMGSSTIDYTVFCPTQSDSMMHNSGSCTGASQIECEIVSRGYSCTESGVDNVEGIKNAMQSREDAGLRADDCECILNLKARKSKEEFYTYNRDTLSIELKGKELSPLLSGFDAAYITELRKSEMLEITKDYRENFKNELANLAKTLKEKGKEPTKILLSGGASRMGFVKEITRNSFPDAEEIKCDTFPEWVVSDGAALYLKTHYNAIVATDNLHIEFQQWCVNSLDQCLKEAAIEAFNNSLQEIARSKIENLYYDANHDGSLNKLKEIVKDVLGSMPKDENFLKKAEEIFTQTVNEKLKENLISIIKTFYGKEVDINENFISADGIFDNTGADTDWISEAISKVADVVCNNMFEDESNLDWDKPRTRKRRGEIISTFAPLMKYDEFTHNIDLSVFSKEAHAMIDKILESNGLFSISQIGYIKNY